MVPLGRAGLCGALLVSLLASAAGIAAAAPAGVSAPSEPLAPAAPTTTYTDPVGDNEDFAPDFDVIVVRLDGGRLTFGIGIANLGPGLIEGEFVAVEIDTDRNPRTGCDGAEVAMAVLGHNGADFARWGRCAGGDFAFGAAQGSFQFDYRSGSGDFGPGAIFFSLNASELGTTHFRFWVGSSYEGIYDDYFDDAGPYSFGAARPKTPPTQAPAPSKRIVITHHPNVQAEAASAKGARVRYAPARVRGADTVSYSKASGSIFPLGRTVVTITARKKRTVARAKFAVVVADRTPPTLMPVSAVSTNATDPTRATVTFGPVIATDRVDSSVSVTCTPASGSVLAPGATSLSCTARDDAGNTASTSLAISVPVFANQMSLQTNTTYQYDGAARLINATTAIAIAVPPAADGSPVTYTWAASNGTITGNGPTASWGRALVAPGQPVAGSVTLTLTFTSGRTEMRTIQFP
jgi:hypothetical protein